MGIKLAGIKELQVKLKDAAQLEAAKKIVKLNGAEMQEKAVRGAPYKTGTLRRSIRLEIKDQGLTAVVSATTNYAGYVEWGTRKMRAQPYMRPAFRRQAAQFTKDIERLTK